MISNHTEPTLDKSKLKIEDFIVEKTGGSTSGICIAIKSDIEGSVYLSKCGAFLDSKQNYSGYYEYFNSIAEAKTALRVFLRKHTNQRRKRNPKKKVKHVTHN